MANGIQIFDASGNVLMDSERQAAMFHSSDWVGGGAQPTIAFPAGVNNCGAVVWSDNGHMISSVYVPDGDSAGWTEVLGSYKHVVQHNAGSVSFSYPDYFTEVLNGGSSNRPGTSLAGLGSANIDLWVN